MEKEIKLLKQLIQQAKNGNAGLIAISVSTAEKLIKFIESKGLIQ